MHLMKMMMIMMMMPECPDSFDDLPFSIWSCGAITCHAGSMSGAMEGLS